MLRQGRAALRDLAVRHVDPDGARETSIVDAAMFEESPVLDGDDRIHEVLGQVVVLDVLSLLLVLIRNGRKKLGLDRNGLECLVGAGLADSGNRRSVLRERHRGGREDLLSVDDGVDPGLDRHALTIQPVATSLGIGRVGGFRVTEIVEVRSQFGDRDVLPGPDGARLRVDARRPNEHVAAKPGVEHAAVLDVEISENAESDRRDDAEDGDLSRRDDTSPEALSTESRLDLLGLKRRAHVRKWRDAQTLAQSLVVLLCVDVVEHAKRVNRDAERAITIGVRHGPEADRRVHIQNRVSERSVEDDWMTRVACDRGYDNGRLTRPVCAEHSFEHISRKVRLVAKTDHYSVAGIESSDTGADARRHSVSIRCIANDADLIRRKDPFDVVGPMASDYDDVVNGRGQQRLNARFDDGLPAERHQLLEVSHSRREPAGEQNGRNAAGA